MSSESVDSHNNNNNAINKGNATEQSTDIIGSILGPFGKFQLRAILLIFLVKIPSSWFMACLIFTAPTPERHETFCKPPVNLTGPKLEQWIRVAHPIKEEINDKEFKIDFCNVYVDAHKHAANYFNNSKLFQALEMDSSMPKNMSRLISCEKFVHTSDYNSIITEYDLVCSRDILVALTQFFHLFGVLCGGCLATYMLYHISPKRVMLIGMVTQIICGSLTGTVPFFGLHMFFRCLSAVCCALMYTAGGMIFSDITAGKYKTSAICLFEQFWSIGIILLPWISFTWKSWSYIYMAISFPTFILIVLHFWIPESPRWMLKHGRLAKVKEILIDAARINGKPTIHENDLDKQLKIQYEAIQQAPPEPNYWSMWKGRRVRRNLIAVHLAWSVYIGTYYGFLLNIRGFGRDYLEVNTVIAGLSEIIGTFIGYGLIMFTTHKWQWTSLLNIAASLIALMANKMPADTEGLSRVAILMVTSMCAKVAISSTLAILTTCTTEIVTPEKRRLCGFATIVWARIWLLTAPFVGATSVYGKLLPQTIMSCMNIFGAMMTGLIVTPRTFPLSSTSSLSSTSQPQPASPQPHSFYATEMPSPDTFILDPYKTNKNVA